MSHLMFAVFESPDVAAAARQAMEAESRLAEERRGEPVVVTVVQRPLDVPLEDLPVIETNVRHSVARGLVVGALGGALVAAIVHAVGMTIVPLVTTALFAMLFGAIVGGIGSLLTGAADPDQELDKLSREVEQRHEVMLAIDVPDLEAEDRVERILASLGARLTHKPLV
jgi:hypothetical protein